LTDVTKKDYLAANWFVLGAPLKKKWRRRCHPRPWQKVCAYSALRNGATTVLDPGVTQRHGRLRGHRWPVRRAGVLSPPYRATIFSLTRKAALLRETEDNGRPGLKRAVEFIQQYHGAHNGRLQGILIRLRRKPASSC
jgi:hypothetical protein